MLEDLGASLAVLAARLPTYFEGVPTLEALLPRRMPTPHREQRAPLRDPTALAVLARICAMDAALYEEARTVLQEASACVPNE